MSRSPPCLPEDELSREKGADASTSLTTCHALLTVHHSFRASGWEKAFPTPFVENWCLMASFLCFQMFSIMYGLLSMLEVSHVTGNIFHASRVVSRFGILPVFGCWVFCYVNACYVLWFCKRRASPPLWPRVHTLSLCPWRYLCSVAAYQSPFQQGAY